jgi:hypothetical protein
MAFGLVQENGCRQNGFCQNHYSKIQGRCQRKMAKMDDFPAFPTLGDQKNGRNEEVPGGKW